jgi:hypothetical protein
MKGYYEFINYTRSKEDKDFKKWNINGKGKIEGNVIN